VVHKVPKKKFKELGQLWASLALNQASLTQWAESPRSLSGRAASLESLTSWPTLHLEHLRKPGRPAAYLEEQP
jgi:hypothetical protein